MTFDTKNFKKGELIHLLWIDWDNRANPTLAIQYRKLPGNTISRAQVRPGDAFNFTVKKYVCIGYPDEDDQIILCLRNREINKGIQCFQCVTRDLLLGCARCKGTECVNKPAWEYCTKTAHVVYLAGFHTGMVKVGTSKRDRLERRLLEQGATTACVIAYAPTQISAKYIEHRIFQDCQVSETMSEKVKVEALTSAELDAQRKAIATVRGKIARTLQLSELVLDEPILEYNALNFKGRLTKLPVEIGTPLRGTVVFTRGRHVVLQNADSNYVVDLFKLRGAAVEIGSHFALAQKQSLFDYV